MSEERFPGDLLESRASSAKVALGVAGIVIGLGVLVCGGVAGYVALTTTGSHVVSEPPSATPRQDPADIRETAQRIIAIDLPADFEPVSREDHIHMTNVVYGRKGVDGAFLKLGRVVLSEIPKGVDLGEAQSKILTVLQMAGTPGGARIEYDTTSPATNREFMILGQPVTFTFVDATLSESRAPVRQARGTFKTMKAIVSLIYVIPKEEFDEDAFRRMIESIRPARGDSAPDAAETSGDGAAQSEATDTTQPDGSGKQDSLDFQGSTP
jgi:hypothetical protein